MTLLVSGINLYAMALVLHTFLGWNWDVSMWVSAVTVAVYVTLSGLMSAIFTEIIQFFLIWFGLFLVSILGIVEIGEPGRDHAPRPGGLRHALVHLRRPDPERDGGHLGGHRPRPRASSCPSATGPPTSSSCSGPSRRRTSARPG